MVAILLLLSVWGWSDFTVVLAELVAFALPQAINKLANAIMLNMRIFNLGLLVMGLFSVILLVRHNIS
ncbi:MAG: hypothetical protein ACYCY1_00860 [Sulfuriferula sp.]